jgi:hypothetical protein
VWFCPINRTWIVRYFGFPTSRVTKISAMSSQSEPMVDVMANGNRNGHLDEVMEKRTWSDEWERAGQWELWIEEQCSWNNRRPNRPPGISDDVDSRPISELHRDSHLSDEPKALTSHYLKQLNLPQLNLHGFLLTPCLSAVIPPPTCFPPQFLVHRNGIALHSSAEDAWSV